MNILILNWRDVRHPKSGGAELVTMMHAKGWVKKGNTVTWLTANYPGAKLDEVVEGVNFVRRAGSQSIYLYAPFYLLMHAHKYDVIVDEVHGFPFFSPIFTRTPVIIFIHEIAGAIWDYMFPFPKNIIGKFLERSYFQTYKSNIFWTDAQSTVDELVEHGIRRDHCFAIPCPVVLDPHSKLEIQKNILKEKFPTFLFISRVVRMKGVEEVIKAFSFIVRSNKDSKLWIVGGGEVSYMQELIRMIREYGVEGNVTFFGNVTDNKKYELMAKAHVLLHASVKEGWGLVVLEAAHVGTPAVVYNVPGLRDVVKHGKTGIVISSNSPLKMAEKALILYHDKKMYTKMQKNAKEWEASLVWEDAIKQSLKLLKDSIQFE